MHNKPDNLEGQPKGAKQDTDTSSVEQLHGKQDSRSAPNRPAEKMPHERDESARPTDDRSTESAPASQRQISQAQKDVAAGLVDTDRRGIPDDVPGGKE